MSRTRIVSVSLAALMLVSLTISADSAAEDTSFDAGDYWKYSFEADEDGLTMTGSLEMKIDRADTLGGKEVFYIDMSGSGEVSGSVAGMTISGSFDLDGEQVRLKSDFDVLSEDIEMTMEYGAIGLTIEMTMGFETQYDPSRDDFIGDGDMTLNSVQTSEFEATADYWTIIGGETSSESESMSGESTLTVVDESVSITVPAGTFDCCKVKVETTMDGTTETEYRYYSTEVGSYVKQDMATMGMGELELEEYSFGESGGGASSLFGGDNLWLILLVIVVVVAIVAVTIVMRSRRGKTPTPMTPLQPETQIPPPEPGQPQIPPPSEPMQPPQSPPPG